MGLMIPTAYSTFNNYFIKRRVLIMSLAQALKGIGLTIYPVVVQYLVEKFGFRGAALIVSAIHAHTIFGMMIMHPVEWHVKEIQVPVDETESCN